ncbi:MAG: 2-amino-4-hydroxy-6-hydroxymethyldihydropteridine diphosphokinase [Synergistaceae bacterium]|jgi:2-amino-4-hydroxy-6-hydroxymethyldihydropteridine diphosphokinase|nr:2-amino-4-hydroxy-6-hydroxymethyldihydropteridine diphosphokinase [Synergistaceae bacterium]
MNTAAVGIGSNKGDRLANIRTAVSMTRERVGTVTAVSDVFETPPWGVALQPRFLNACMIVEAEISPRALLAKLKEIENDMGRLKRGKWGPREIDLDILFFDDIRTNEADLVIPHPYMHDRAFVLLPLSKIAPDWIHPALGMRVSELLQNITAEGIIRITSI